MFAHNWSAKLEYLYYDLGKASLNSPVQYVNAVTGATGLGASQTSAQFNGRIIRAGSSSGDGQLTIDVAHRDHGAD